MNSFIVFSCLLAAASANPQILGFAPAITSQFHAQDELGQYHYGYSGGPSAKEEIRTADGITRGGYSYIDAHGIVQSASYVSDPVNGFRVAATNLPVGPSAPAALAAAPAVIAPAPIAAPAVVAAPHPIIAPAAVAVAGPAETPEVIAAKAAHFAAHNEALVRLGRKRRSVALAAPLAIAPARSFAYSTVAASPLAHHIAYSAPIARVAAPLAHPLAYSAPVAAAAPLAHPLAYSAPIAAAAPLAYSAPIAAPVAPLATQSQYHAQDELGQYSYGYNNINSAKTETKTADGITRGAYSYVDGNGIVQSTNYVADALGFRVAATNLPVGPA